MHSSDRVRRKETVVVQTPPLDEGDAHVQQPLPSPPGLFALDSLLQQRVDGGRRNPRPLAPDREGGLTRTEHVKPVLPQTVPAHDSTKNLGRSFALRARLTGSRVWVRQRNLRSSRMRDRRDSVSI